MDKSTRIVLAGFRAYICRFERLTTRARRHFQSQNVDGMKRDYIERLDLYGKIVGRMATVLDRWVGAARDKHVHWAAVKKQYARAIADYANRELAETFFNSITRRRFHCVGVHPAIEFIDAPLPPEDRNALPLYTTELSSSPREEIAKLLGIFDLHSAPADCLRDADRVVDVMTASTCAPAELAGTRIEMLSEPFFRDLGAYLVGRRKKAGQATTPFVMALRCKAGRPYVDALLQEEEQVRVLFSFARSHFFVKAPIPSAIVRFIHTLMPHRHISELYIALGYHKHGKTELYRELRAHLAVCGAEQFDFSPGQRGMVMIAFNMPGDYLVYKVIRDRFDRPKTTSRDQVMAKYDYVFKHDRAGRLVDVQTFEHLTVDACCFADELLAEFETQATSAVHLNGDQVVLRHVYVERRVTPLDLFIRQRPDEAKAAIDDYGQAIKDLACVDVFPGDMLLKNFGVTRLGRVVFYDYDELCPITECRFRRLPPPADDLQAFSTEPWFMVEEQDVFPEEFRFFLGMPAEVKAHFLERHEDLLSPAFWRAIQDRIRAGEWLPIRPYDEKSLLRPP
ncbi:MAG: bifunctional isocitrate dehydrogenase kinase/phosphatase [Desulfosarcinaceae bacterium]